MNGGVLDTLGISDIELYVNNLFVNPEVHEIFIKRIDERFTSKIAKQSILDAGIKKMKRRDKALVDKVSAAIILQSYLDAK